MLKLGLFITLLMTRDTVYSIDLHIALLATMLFYPSGVHAKEGRGQGMG